MLRSILANQISKVNKQNVDKCINKCSAKSGKSQSVVIATLLIDLGTFTKSQLDAHQLIHNPELTVEDLEVLVVLLSHYYYNTNTTLVLDTDFDYLYDKLQSNSPNSEILTYVGGSATLEENTESQNLEYFLGSLDKFRPDEPKKSKSFFTRNPGPFLVSDKLDGTSALLMKQTSTNSKLFTKEGTDISHLIPFVITKNILKKLCNSTAIRGELIISKENFQNHFDKGESRTVGNGLVLTLPKRVKERSGKLRYLEFVPYEIVDLKGERLPIGEQFTLLEKWFGGDKVAWNTILQSPNVKNTDSVNTASIDTLVDLLIARRENSPYQIDGLVLSDNSGVHELSNKKYPDYAIAFKVNFQEDERETVVKKVTWEPSRYGRLQPKVWFDPVEIAGTTVKKATGSTAKRVIDEGIGPNAVIRVIKSGAIIPHITAVVKSTPKNKLQLPTGNYEWDKTHIHFVLKENLSEEEDPLIVAKQLKFFFETIGAEFLGEKTLLKFVENGYDTVPKILKVNKKDLYKAEGLSKKIIDKIYDSMGLAFEKVDLASLAAGSATLGQGIGVKSAKLAFENYPDLLLENYDEDELYEMLVNIKGFGKITAEQISQNFHKFREWWEEVNIIVSLPSTYMSGVGSSSNTMKGMNIVMTGTREFDDWIKANGGEIKSSVSKNTNLVIYKAPKGTGAKYNKAIELGIPTMSDTEFREKYLK